MFYLADRTEDLSLSQSLSSERLLQRGKGGVFIYPIMDIQEFLQQKPGSSEFEKITVKEKEMATHSSMLAWKIPWTEDPGRLQSMGSQRVGHN